MFDLREIPLQQRQRGVFLAQNREDFVTPITNQFFIAKKLVNTSHHNIFNPCLSHRFLPASAMPFGIGAFVVVVYGPRTTGSAFPKHH